MTKADSYFDETLNVLFLVDRWVSGGVKKHLMDLCQQFSAKGINCIIVGWLPRFGSPPEGIEFHHIPLYDDQGSKSLPGFFKSVIFIRKLLKNRTIDVLHLHSRYLTPTVAFAAMGQNLPTVFTSHNIFQDLRFLPWYPQNVICLNKVGKQSFLKNKCLPRNHEISVVPNGIAITTGLINQSSADKSDNPESQVTGRPLSARAPAGKRESFLFMGRLEKWKGVDLILRALAEIEEQDIEIEIAGSGPEEPALRSLARDLGVDKKVKFHGYLDNPMHLLERSAALIVPSRELEGFGYVVLEAYSRRCPVIASDLPVFDETVCEGITGLRFRNGDHHSLASAMRRVLDQPAQLVSMGENGLALLREKYSLDQMIEATLAVYKKAIAK